MAYKVDDDPCTNDTGHQDVCTFRLVNGYTLIAISSGGFILSWFAIVCIVSKRIKLPGCKGIFILNVSITDVALATVGIFRGLGIVCSKFSGVNQQNDTTPGPYCLIYTISSNAVFNSVIMSLLPLTLDRFLAIVFAARYKAWVTRKTSIMMVVVSWVPTLVFCLYEVISYSLGYIKIVYQASYHRCVYESEAGLVEVTIFNLLPFLLLCSLYISIMTVIFSKNIAGAKLMLGAASAILPVGLVLCVPETLLAALRAADVTISYKAAQVVTVTLYYTNSVANPVIYFLANPIVRRQLSTRRVRRSQENPNPPSSRPINRLDYSAEAAIRKVSDAQYAMMAPK